MQNPRRRCNHTHVPRYKAQSQSPGFPQSQSNTLGHHVAHTRQYVHNQFAPRMRSPHQLVRRTYLSPPGLSLSHAPTHRCMHATQPLSLARTHARNAHTCTPPGTQDGPATRLGTTTTNSGASPNDESTHPPSRTVCAPDHVPYTCHACCIHGPAHLCGHWTVPVLRHMGTMPRQCWRRDTWGQRQCMWTCTHQLMAVLHPIYTM